MTVIRARFRTHERAMQAYRVLEAAMTVELPVREDDSGYPWTVTIVLAHPVQQGLVVGTVRRFDGVTFQETS